MNTYNKFLRNTLLILVFFIAAVGCKKTTPPPLGDYPVDANPPGGPLKFYVAFNGSTTNTLMNGVDSIRATFPATNTSAATDGISGKAFGASETALARYASPNDWTKSTNFTIAFWMKKVPQGAGKGTNLAFSLNAKGYSWTNTKLFFFFEDWSTAAVGNCKFFMMDQWVEYVNANGMPNILNNQWHHLAFTYDGASSKLIAYLDGVLFRTNTVGAPLGPVNFGTFDDFTIGGPNAYTNSQQSWMNNFNGSIDQFRLYGTILSAADVMALFTNKL